MKGLIAPLLALMMTGMVFSQQPQPSRFDSGRADATTRPLLNKFLLEMSDADIAALKSHGFLEAEIEPQDQELIDHVMIQTTDTSNLISNQSPWPIIPLPAADTSVKLEFVLNDTILLKMKERRLQYIIPERDRNRFDRVSMIYESDRAVRQPVTNNSRMGDRSSEFSRSNNFNGRPGGFETRRTTGNEQAPFIGPDLPEDPILRERILRNQGFNGSNMTQDRRITDVTPRRNDSFETDLERRARLERDRQREMDMDVERARRVAQNTFPRTDNREFDDRSQWSRGGERSRSEGLSRNDRGRSFEQANPNFRSNEDELYRNEANRRSGDRQLADRRLNERRLNEPESQLAEYEKLRLAEENSKLKRRLEDELLLREKTEKELAFEKRLARADATERDRRLREVDERYPYGEDRVGDSRNRRYANRRPEDYGDQIVIEDTRPRDQYTNMPHKNDTAVVPKPTNRPPAFAIGGPEGMIDSASAHSRTNQALWFIMLCSVGLNFYLGLIARGFYVRYEELADEIRDTFTSTM